MITRPRAPRAAAWRRAARGLLAAAALAAAGCGPAPDEAALLHAVAQVAEGDCAGADPALRAHLLARPDSAMGHYLFGRCAHAQGPAHFARAQGEYRTALQLLRRGADIAPFAAAYPGRQLEVAVHAALATLHLEWADVGFDYGAPPEFMRDHIRQAKYHINEIRQVPGFDAGQLETLEDGATRRRARLRALLGTPDLTV